MDQIPSDLLDNIQHFTKSIKCPGNKSYLLLYIRFAVDQEFTTNFYGFVVNLWARDSPISLGWSTGWVGFGPTNQCLSFGLPVMEHLYPRVDRIRVFTYTDSSIYIYLSMDEFIYEFITTI